MARKSILLIGGSMNQTTIVHQVANCLKDHDCWFSPFYGDGWLRAAASAGMLEFSIMGRRARGRAGAYLLANGCPVDDGGTARGYDLVVTCTDIMIPRNIRGNRIVLIQEGMVDPENLVYHLVRALGLPRYLGNTSMTGVSGAYRAFCVASEGFKDIFVRKGADPGKIRVTGIPNFDHVESYRNNGFPLKNYVLAATSYLRECFKYENRKRFILKALAVADGRPVAFKLHPQENAVRAVREIRRYAPGRPIYADCNTNHMIANCDALVTRYSSVVLVAAAMGKEIHSDLEPGFLERIKPVQNGGRAARNIADVCREVLA
jgi:hypothetical protein